MMRSVLLLFALLFCLQAEAKNKVYHIDINTQKVTTHPLEKEVLKMQTGSEFHDQYSPVNPYLFITPLDGSLYYGDPYGGWGHNFNYSENSYKITSSGSSGFLKNDSALVTVKNGASIDSQTLFRQGMFYGFAIMLILLNLVCFFLFEDKTFLYYSLALTAMSLMLFFSDGLFSLFGWSTNSAIYSQSLLLLIATSFSALFISKYLNLNEFTPKLKYFTISLLTVSALLVVTSWITENRSLAMVTNVISFGVIGTYFMAGVYLFGRKNYAKFLVIASFIPLIFCLDFYVLAPLGINFLATETTHLKAAMIAEMLILTYAIVYRMQAIKEEHALRQAELRIFLKRQEVLTARKQTEKMVEDVYLENLIMHYDLDGLEIKLLQYISEGKENHKIARKLKTTEHEVEELTKELYDKLEISEQIQQDYRMVDSQPDYIYN